MTGFIVLSPDQGVTPLRAEIETALTSAGWERWDGSGNPALVVFHVGGPKGDYFEAGFWAGRGVPVFFLGGGARCHSRKQIVNRLSGWTVVGQDNRASVVDLLQAIERRKLLPVPSESP
jgi:hypothetical protein